MKRLFLSLLVILITIGILIPISYWNTRDYWHGNYPRAEVRITVVDDAGVPVQGSRLNVYDVRTKEPCTDKGIVYERDLVSDKDGQIIFHCTAGRTVGIVTWKLLWLIPIKTYNPDYTCEIVKDGYKPLVFSIGKLFDWYSDAYKKGLRVPFNVYGTTDRLHVFEHTFKLDKSKR